MTTPGHEPFAAPLPVGSRRRGGALVGAFLGMLLSLGALALATRSSEQPVREPTPQQAVAAALSTTDELTTYEMTIDEIFDDGSYIRGSGLFAGEDSRILSDFGGSTTASIRVEGREFQEADDGSWMETVSPARAVRDSSDMVGEMWLSLQKFSVAEGDAGEGRYVLACPDDTATLDKDWQWICEGPAPSRPEITLDPTRRFVAELYVEGDIPTYPGETRTGSLTVLTEVSDEPLVVAIPDRIDSSGIECLAESLGVPGADAAELSVLIDENTTSENGRLFGGCGFPVFPPGIDFDLG